MGPCDVDMYMGHPIPTFYENNPISLFPNIEIYFPVIFSTNLSY